MDEVLPVDGDDGGLLVAGHVDRADTRAALLALARRLARAVDEVPQAATVEAMPLIARLVDILKSRAVNDAVPAETDDPIGDILAHRLARQGVDGVPYRS